MNTSEPRNMLGTGELPADTERRLRDRGAVFATVRHICGQTTPITVSTLRPLSDVAASYFAPDSTVARISTAQGTVKGTFFALVTPVPNK